MATLKRKLKKWFGKEEPQSSINLDSSNEVKHQGTKVGPKDRSSGGRNKGDKKEKKDDPPEDEDSNPKKKRYRGKKKKRKEIHKICSYCLEWFITYRMDTKYCCDSCKVTASKNNHIRWNYANVGEHILVEAISRIIGDIKSYNGKDITRSQMDYWIKLTLFIMKLFGSVIIEGNEHFLFAKNNVWGFLENLQKKYHDVPDIQEWYLTVPKDLIDMWQEFLDAHDFDSEKDNKMYVYGVGEMDAN